MGLTRGSDTFWFQNFRFSKMIFLLILFKISLFLGELNFPTLSTDESFISQASHPCFRVSFLSVDVRCPFVKQTHSVDQLQRNKISLHERRKFMNPFEIDVYDGRVLNLSWTFFGGCELIIYLSNQLLFLFTLAINIQARQASVSEWISGAPWNLIKCIEFHFHLN